jgi:hypothetical protein
MLHHSPVAMAPISYSLVTEIKASKDKSATLSSHTADSQGYSVDIASISTWPDRCLPHSQGVMQSTTPSLESSLFTEYSSSLSKAMSDTESAGTTSSFKMVSKLITSSETTSPSAHSQSPTCFKLTPQLLPSGSPTLPTISTVTTQPVVISTVSGMKLNLIPMDHQPPMTSAPWVTLSAVSMTTLLTPTSDSDYVSSISIRDCIPANQ